MCTVKIGNLDYLKVLKYQVGPLHRGAICQFPVRWIYYCHSSESIGKKTGKTHLCALVQNTDYERLVRPGEEIIFTARPKIYSHSQIFRYGRSIFCLPHRPKSSDFFDLCLHWVPVVRGKHQHFFLLQLLHTEIHPH